MAINKTTNSQMFILRGDKYVLTTTQLKWIVSALYRDIARCRKEMDEAEDGSPVQSLGEIFISGREHLINQLEDIIQIGVKKITIQ
jgi:hypothetical protein